MKDVAWISRCSLFLGVIFCGPVSLSAQELACRAGAGSAGPGAVGRVEMWPVLSTGLFIGPDARAALLSDGSAVLVDRAKNDLIRIDRESGHVTVLARKGEGPGEIKAIVGLLTGAGDTITAVDLGNHRVTRFTREGRVAASYPYKFAGIAEFHGQFGSDLVEVSRTVGSRGKADAVEMSFRALRADSAVTLRTAKLSDPPNEVGIFTQTGVAASKGAAQLVLASGAGQDLNVFGLRGGPDRVVHLDIGPPIRINQSMATHLVTLASSRIPEASRQAIVTAMLQKVPTNPTYPLFSRMIIGTDGNIWVQRTFSGEGDGPKDPPVTFSLNDLGGFRWEQFSPTGARMANCTMPQDWRILSAGAGWVLFAEDDADNTRLFTWRPK